MILVYYDEDANIVIKKDEQLMSLSLLEAAELVIQLQSQINNKRNQKITTKECKSCGPTGWKPTKPEGLI